MDTLRLADGTELETDFCYPMTNDSLSITIYKKNFLEAVMLLSDPLKTCSILYIGKNGLEKCYAGYTQVEYVALEGTHLRATLRKVEEA